MAPVFLFAFALVITAAGLGTRSSLAQDTRRMQSNVSSPKGFLKSCPSGHRIQFMFGSTSLYIDPHWLDGISLVRLMDQVGAECPKGPVERSSRHEDSLFFNHSVLDLAGVPSGLGRPYLQFLVSKAVSRPEPPPPTAPPQQLREPRVDDVTKLSSPNAGATRLYRLSYADDGSGSTTTVDVMCAGKASQPAGRHCETKYPTHVYRYGRDLTVRYTFKQNVLPPPGEGKTANLMTDAEAVLAFDRRIRAWIDSLRQKP